MNNDTSRQDPDKERQRGAIDLAAGANHRGFPLLAPDF